MASPASSSFALRPWQRLSVRLAASFAVATLLAVGVVGSVIYQRQTREVEDTIGTQLLNIARTSALLVDPALHAEAQCTRALDSPAYRRLHQVLSAIQTELVLATPIYTLADYDRSRREARLMVTSGEGALGAPYPLAAELVEPLGWTFEDGVARYTRIYRNQSGTWITAFAPIVDGTGRTIAVLDVDYPVDVYLDRLSALRTTVLQASAAGALGALALGLLVARRLTRPIVALTRAAGRVATGDLSTAVPIRSRDEVGALTRAFNEMVEGLRQRDFIRDTFGRYVSPEVVETLLASPEGLRLGGEKREVTILMSDLRGYTRFAEQGDPEMVMAVLNDYLARMADIVIAHGGTINEFIGDAIFAVFGAPVAHMDHAERAAATALAMQLAMDDINRAHVERGIPRFEMGIGINSGEAVVGNIGSEQRAKYAVVGSAVNVAGRVESATVGGQVLVTAPTHDRIRDLAEVGTPIPIEVKGIAAPLILYDLHGLGGRFARRLPGMTSYEDRGAEAALPIQCWTMDGKVVRRDRVAGVTVRVGRHTVEACLDAALTPLANVRLRLAYPWLGRESGDLYGKVVSEEERDGVRLARIRLTSIDPEDEKVFETLIEERRP